jgi:hypothetical protein
MVIDVYLSDISNGEHIEVNTICTATYGGPSVYLTFSPIDTTNGVVIDYWAGLC